MGAFGDTSSLLTFLFKKRVYFESNCPLEVTAALGTPLRVSDVGYKGKGFAVVSGNRFFSFLI
jgi:hypothetical protein